jgi:hypothetical protein
VQELKQELKALR